MQLSLRGGGIRLVLMGKKKKEKDYYFVNLTPGTQIYKGLHVNDTCIMIDKYYI